MSIEYFGQRQKNLHTPKNKNHFDNGLPINWLYNKTISDYRS